MVESRQTEEQWNETHYRKQCHFHRLDCDLSTQHPCQIFLHFLSTNGCRIILSLSMAFFFFLILQRKLGRIQNFKISLITLEYLQEDKQLVLLIRALRRMQLHSQCTGQPIFFIFLFLKGIRKTEQELTHILSY